MTFYPIYDIYSLRQLAWRSTIKLRLCTLASGSKGNCIYVEGGQAKILVDAGLSMRETRARLACIGVDASEISAIIITHEHTDHIKGVGALGRAYGMPVYLTPDTRKAGHGWLGKGLQLREFEPGSAFDILGLRIEPFSTPHDAVDPVGLVFHAGGCKAGLATDLGYATRLVMERLKGSNLLIIESNHDPEMLMAGPYPWHLKQRVAGKEGHLSNEDSVKLLTSLLDPGLSHVVLAHLSQVNNLPEIAFKAVHKALLQNSCGHIKLGVACQDSVGEVIGV